MNNYHYNIEHVVQKYCRNIAMLAFTYTKNVADAEDIAQKVFLQLVKSKRDFDSEEHLRAWLFRITINKSKNHLKSFWVSKRGDFPKDTSPVLGRDYDLIQVVLRLEPKYRLPVHLFYYEGYSIKEISQILNEKESTIGTRLKRARTKLKDMLGSDYYG